MEAHDSSPPEIHNSPIDRAFAGLGRFSVRFRWPILVFWLALAGLLPGALPSLSSQTKAQNSDFLPKGTPSLHAAELASPFQARNALSTLLVAGRSTAALTAADQAAFERVERSVRADRSVLDVRDQGLSRDGAARRATIEFHDNVSFQDADKVLKRLRGAFRFAAVPQGLSVHLAGQLAQAADRQTQNSRNRSLTQQLSILFILVLLFVVFRALLAPIITLLPAFLSVLVAGPLIAEAAQAGVEVSSLTQILLTVIVLGAGTDYGLFLIYRVREQLARGASPRDAVAFALSRVGETITFSAACVILALLSLVFARFGLYRGLGPGLAIGITVVLVAGLTLLPALLAIFGRRAFWPTRPQPGREYTGAWGRIAGRVVARPGLTLGAGLALFVGLALALIAYSPAGFGTEQAPSGSDSAGGEQVLRAHFPVAVRNPTNIVFRFAKPVWSDPSPLDRSARALAAAPALDGLIGPLEPNGTALSSARVAALYKRLGPPHRLPLSEPAALRGSVAPNVYAAYKSSAQFISVDGRTTQYYATLRAGDPGSAQALDAIPAVRREVDSAARNAGAVDHGVAGEAAAAYDISGISTSDLQRIVPIVLLVIALLLVILLRSLVAPLYLIFSVGLSYLAALGLAIAVFMGIEGHAGLNFVLPFFMFVFLMALGSDYNILVMTRIREEARRMSLRDAVAHALAATGGTVTSAGLVLAGTFAVLTVSGDSQTQEIGLGLAAGILLDTFLVRTLLIPATVVLVGHWNWWPSTLQRDDAGR